MPRRPIVDIVGHFGTEFSYGTVASNVAHALDRVGLLGVVSNLDPKWHKSHSRLADRTMRGHGTHVIVFAPPNHYLDAFAKTYGRDRSAIFMSPNTDTLDEEHAMTCAAFSLALCPSSWCRMTVERAVPDMETEVLPLGVDPLLWNEESYNARIERLQGVNHRTTVVHFSSDQYWPGRKGTEELFRGWARGGLGQYARMIAHVPPALLVPATYLLRELDIDDSVELVVGESRGAANNMRTLFHDADAIVAPSRCEGFGIMLLSALYAGVPLVCTYGTGHADFLRQHHGWVGIPTRESAMIYGEAGTAPVVEPVAISTSLNATVSPLSLARMMSTNDAKGDPSLTWDHRVKEWVEAIGRWARGEG